MSPSPPRLVKANPVRKLPVFKVELLHEHTKPVHFKLPGDDISKQKREKFKAQIDELFAELEAYRNFSAQPLPNCSPDVRSLISSLRLYSQRLPEVARKAPTRTHPFHLRTDERGEVYQYELEKKIHEDEMQSQTVKNFIAQPLPFAEPFIPHKSAKRPTEPESFHLNTDTRLHERKTFDEQIKRKMEYEEELKLMLEKERLVIE